jgi:hypothetical protein
VSATTSNAVRAYGLGSTGWRIVVSIANLALQEVVYSPEMAEKISAPVLEERLNNAIKNATWFAGLVVVFGAFVTVKLMDHGDKISAITEKVSNIDQNVKLLLEKQMKAILSTPNASLANAYPSEIADAAKMAITSRAIVSRDGLKHVAEPLLENVTPPKWAAVTQLLNLRSLQNSTLEEAKQHVIQYVRGGEFVKPRNDGEWAQVEGGVIALDGDSSDPNTPHNSQGPVRVLGNVIFKGVHVIYGGGRLSLENVFFEDCTFSIAENSNGIAFARSVLDTSALTSFVAD